MALDSTAVRKGLVINLFMGDYGATMPTNTTTPIDVDDFTNLGYISEDGATQGNETESAEVKAAQTRLPVRTDIIGQTITLAMTLIQISQEALKLAYNGGEFTAGATPGDMVFTPPAASTSTEHAFVFELVDGDVVTRFRYPRGILSELGDIAFNKNDPVGYEITITMLEPGVDTAPWDFVTNDPSLAVASSS